MLRRTLFVAILLSVAFSIPAFAQTRAESVEVTPFASYVFGGTLDKETNHVFDRDVDVDDHAAWGLRVGYDATDVFAFEVAYLRDRTEVVDAGGLFEPDHRLADIDVDILEAAALFHLGGPRFFPFFEVGLGATRLELGDGSSDTRPQASIGGGLKLVFSDRVGFRLDARHHWTYLDHENDCRRCNDHSLGLTEVSAGLVFAF